MNFKIISEEKHQHGDTVTISIEGFENFGRSYMNVMYGMEDDDGTQLMVGLAPGCPFTENRKKTLETMFSNWEEIRIWILDGVFDYYSKRFKELREDSFCEPEDIETQLPEPTGWSAIENLFRIDHIYLWESPEKIGLYGRCSWDDEHGVGILLEELKVIDVGDSDIAYGN